VSFTGPGTKTITLTVTDTHGGTACTRTDTVDLTVYALPTADAGLDQSACYTGSDVAFNLTGTATGTGTLSYQWTGTGVTITNGTTSTPTVSFTGPGTKTITLTVTDTHGGTACTRTDTVDLTVYPSPSASITTPDPAQVYAKVALQLHGNPTGGSGTYTVQTWTGAGATHLTATNIENPIFTADALGSYPLTYTVTDSHGCQGYDDIVVQVINAKPEAQYQGPLTTCRNTALAVTLTATDAQLDPLDPTLHPLTFASNSAPSHGAISGNLGAVTYTAPHAASVTVTYTPVPNFLGTDTFTFIVTDPFGAFGIGTITVTVQECEQVAGGGGGVFADVVINEVAWGGTEASPEDEWIELRNNTDRSIDLTGWTLRWRRKHPATPEEEQWKIVNLSGTIAPAGYYLLERSDDEAVSDVTANLIYGTTSPYSLELRDLGEAMELVNTDGDVVDTSNADHPERDGWIAGAGPDGVPPFGTMERIDPLSPDTDSNWATNRHLIVNGLDALTDVLTATAVMVNENTLIRTLGGETPQVVQVGELVTITVEFPLATGGAEGLPQVILAQMNAAAGGGGAALEPLAQAAVLSSKRIGGTYELSLDTSTLAPGTYGLWLSMGNGVFHGLVFEVVEG
jgi:PKD repeat protein